MRAERGGPSSLLSLPKHFSEPSGRIRCVHLVLIQSNRVCDLPEICVGVA